MNNRKLKCFKNVSFNFTNWVKIYFPHLNEKNLKDEYLNNCFCEFCVVYTEVLHTSTQINSNCIQSFGNHTINANNLGIVNNVYVYEKTFSYSDLPKFFFGTKKECLEFCKSNNNCGFSSLNPKKFLTILGAFDLRFDKKKELFFKF